MAVFFVDYENVCSSNGLKGVEFLNEGDELTIFYSNVCQNIRKDHMNDILGSGCIFKAYKLVSTSKNALDFYIAAETGAVAEKGGRQMAIISNDKGFNAVVDFMKLKYKDDDMHIVRVPNIESGIIGISAADDSVRRKKIHESMSSLNIGQEYAMYKQRNEFARRIKEAMEETDYADRTNEIIQYISERKESTPREFYTGTLHNFGRRDGVEIYRILKKII